MSNKWLNNKKRIHKTENLEKPCHRCGYCPYGQLVEAFPLHEAAIKYAIEHNLYSRFVKGQGWIECGKEEPDAAPNLNKAIQEVDDPYSCQVFGHDCPVYYMAERVTEGEKCSKCGSNNYRQVTPEEQEKEDPEGYAKHGFYSFMECNNCGNRWFDD